MQAVERAIRVQLGLRESPLLKRIVGRGFDPLQGFPLALGIRRHLAIFRL